MPSRSDTARRIVDISGRLYEKGFVAATDGNVSSRFGKSSMLITPTGVNKGEVTARSIVKVAITVSSKGKERNASSELDMHRLIYERRQDVVAVVHAHPPFATGFAAARVPLTPHLLPEVIVGLGTVPLAPYATPSTTEVRESILPFVDGSNAILLSNHGVVTFGATLEEAYFRLEKVEHAAHVAFVAKVLGGAIPLNGEELDRLKRLDPFPHAT